MKKLKIFSTILGFCFLFVSCSSDDSGDSNNPNQDQIDALIGIWNLVEFNVNPAQDVNDDGTTSTNLLDEMSCISGALVLREDFTWVITDVQINITHITEGDFGIFCGSSVSNSGTWAFTNNQVVLTSEIVPEESDAGSYDLGENTLTRTENDDLPDFQSIVYQKQ